MGLRAIAKELRISLLGGRYAADIWSWLGSNSRLQIKDKKWVARLRPAARLMGSSLNP
jgi:hypothetical protein